MQACGGSAMMSSIQQTVWTQGSAFHSKLLGLNGCSNNVKLSSMKPCRSSPSEVNLVTGKPSSSASVPIHEIEGGKDYNSNVVQTLENHGLFSHIIAYSVRGLSLSLASVVFVCKFPLH